MSSETRLQQCRRWIDEQRKWIDEHGGNMAAYVARYGSVDDPNHSGDGGEAIFRADAQALRDLEKLEQYLLKRQR